MLWLCGFKIIHFTSSFLLKSCELFLMALTMHWQVFNNLCLYPWCFVLLLQCGSIPIWALHSLYALRVDFCSAERKFEYGGGFIKRCRNESAQSLFQYILRMRCLSANKILILWNKLMYSAFVVHSFSINICMFFCFIIFTFLHLSHFYMTYVLKQVMVMCLQNY